MIPLRSGWSTWTLATTILTAMMVHSVAGRGHGGDWPRFRGAGGDGHIADFRAPATWPGELKLRWRVPIGQGHASPIVVGDRVFTLTSGDREELIRCLSLATGAEQWSGRYAADPKLDGAVGPYGRSPRATPAAAGGRLFTLGAGGVLSALDAASGRLLWRETFVGKFPSAFPAFGAAASPLLHDEHCIALVGGKDAGALVAYDVTSGKVAWQLACEGPGYASPVILKLNGVETIVVQTQAHVIGVSLTGSKRWSIPFETAYQQNIVTAVAHRDHLIFSGYNQPLQAWQIAGPEPVRAWQNPAHPIYMSSPVVKGDLVFGMSQRQAGQIFCVDARSGRTLWTSGGRAGKNVSLQVAGDLLVLLNDSGTLTFARAAADRYAVEKEYKLAERGAFAHPVLARDCVLIKDDQHLACFETP